MAATRIFVLQAIENLTLAGVPNDDLQLDHDCVITTNVPKIRELAVAFGEATGGLMHDPLSKCAAANLVVQDADDPPDEALLSGFLLRTSSLVAVFFQALWLIRDNSVNAAENLLVVASTPGQERFQYKRASTLNFTAGSEIVRSHYTEAETTLAADYFDRLMKVLPQVPWDPLRPRSSGLIHESRLARTLYFLQAARAHGDPAVKIAYYCMCLECLFSTDAVEATHKISERTAFFVGNSADRRAIFEDVRELYGVRSKVVHGGFVDENKLPRLRGLAVRCDDYLRKALLKILGDPKLIELFSRKKNADALRTRFTDDLFPAPPNAESPPGT